MTAPGASASVTSDADGKFSVPSVPSGSIYYLMEAPGYLDHYSSIEVNGTRTDIHLTAISVSGSFSLATYRQFARNNFDTTGLAALNPWTVAPKFYVRTVLDETNEPIPPEIIASIRRIFGRAVPELTAGQFEMSEFAIGTDNRSPQPGWITVNFVHVFSDQRGGEAHVGPLDGGGYIRLRYDPANLDAFGLDPYQCGWRTVSAADHEIVHAMGYYHTDQSGLDFQSGQGCPGFGRPQRVRDMAAAMYSRPSGNMDPDRDPVSYSSLLAARPIPPTPLVRYPAIR
jgi:hypothetical protein